MNRNTSAINKVHGIPVSTGVDGGSDDEDSEDDDDDDDDEVEPEPAGDEYDDDDDDDLWPLSLNESGSTQYGLCRRLPSSTLVALTERHSPGGGSDTAL